MIKVFAEGSKNTVNGLNGLKTGKTPASKLAQVVAKARTYVSSKTQAGTTTGGKTK